MSTTFFQVLSDDPQLEKQIGCMTGLLQIFDRQQALLRGKRTTRRISSSGAKAPPTTVSPNNAAAASLNHSPGRGMKKTGDNTPSAGDMVVLELGHRESSCGALEQSSSTSSGSHHRFLRSSSSPSPAEFKEAADPKRGGSVDLKESLRLLAKLKEAPWNDNREVELPSRLLLLQDAPRLSYDGVRSCFEFKDALRSSQRARDAPRLSLDGRRSNCATRPTTSTAIRMRPTSNVVARLMGLPELPDPCHTREEAKASQLGRSTSNKERQSSGANKEDVAADAAAGRKVKRRSSSSSRYVMETMPRPPPSQDSSCSMHFNSNKALTKKRSSLVAKTNPGFSQDMEKQMMYLRLEESVEQRNILKDIVEVLHLKGLLHWHGAEAKLNPTTTQTSIEQAKIHLVPSAKAECQASPRRDISHQNVRRLNTGDGVTTKVRGSRARQKNAISKKESCSGNRPNTKRASEAAVRATTQVQVHAKTTTKPVRYNVLGKSTSQRDESQVMMQECRGSMALAADAHDQQHSPASVLDTTTLLVKFDDCRHPRAADQVEAYVKQILDAAGWLHGGHPLHCLNSTLFLALEKGMQDTTKVAVMHRRLIFDCVNHILARQMRQPCCFTNSWWHPQELVHQVVEELQQLESCARFEDVGEMLQDIVDKDVAAMSDGSSDQACELALHVERLLFKQLVDETIQDMTKLSSIRSMHVSTTRRQLFLL